LCFLGIDALGVITFFFASFDQTFVASKKKQCVVVLTIGSCDVGTSDLRDEHCTEKTEIAHAPTQTPTRKGLGSPENIVVFRDRLI